MLGEENPYIIGPLMTKRNWILLAVLPGLLRIVNDAFPLVARTYLAPEPRYELGRSYIVFLFGNKTSYFEPSLVAVLLCDDDPAVVVVFILGEKFLK